MICNIHHLNGKEIECKLYENSELTIRNQHWYDKLNLLLLIHRIQECTGMSAKRIYGLDCMRALAIMLVLASHMFNRLEFFGYVGVELFFVLSGFLIGGILIKSLEKQKGFNRRDLRRFLIRRFLRTLPNYYLFLLIYSIFERRVAPGIEKNSLDYLRYCLFLQNFAWPNPSGYFSHSWSLCIEEWFYLLTSITLFFMLNITGNTESGRIRALGLTAVGFIVLPNLLKFSLGSGFDDLRMVVVFRLDAIMYGVLMALLQSRFPAWWGKSHFLFMAGSGISIAGIFLYGRSIQAEALALSLMPMGFSLMIPAIYRLCRTETRIDKAVEWTATLSYSIYLCHIIIYFGLQGPLGYNQMSLAGKLVYKVFSVVLIFSVSFVIYRFFEKPVTDFRDRLTRESGRIDSKTSG